VLVFIATSISSGSILQVSNAIANQAGVSSATISSQPWTILTALFIHDGIYHILFNMLTLYFFGMYVLALVGETRFFLVYFIAALWAMRCSCCWRLVRLPSGLPGRFLPSAVCWLCWSRG